MPCCLFHICCCCCKHKIQLKSGHNDIELRNDNDYNDKKYNNCNEPISTNSLIAFSQHHSKETININGTHDNIITGFGVAVSNSALLQNKTYFEVIIFNSNFSSNNLQWA